MNEPKMSLDARLVRLKAWNTAYRDHDAVVDDATYDAERAELASAFPNDPFFNAPEPESVVDAKRFRHRVPMLSTNKLYSDAEARSFVRQVLSEADGESLMLRITPKLDGIAAYDYGDALVTRGKNGWGNRIDQLWESGLARHGDGLPGAGEIVLDLEFFETQMRERFGLKHPRNVISGLAGADTLDEKREFALSAGAVHFVPYSSLRSIEMSTDEFIDGWQAALVGVTEGVPYKCDGAVVEVIDPATRERLGSTGSYHRYMAALKQNDEFAEATVLATPLQTGRTGRVTPKVVIEPTEMYGVTVRQATAHNAAWLAERGIGPGARLLLTRGGGVIPKIVKVIEPSQEPVDLSTCPECGGATVAEGERYIRCPHTEQCDAQAVRGLMHWFSTLGTCNGFGPAVCKALVQGGYLTPSAVYAMSKQDMLDCGLSEGVAMNLRGQLYRSRAEPIAKHIFLGAIGIRHLGRRDSQRLLEHYALDALCELTAEDIMAIHGFGEITSPLIAEQLREQWPEIEALLVLGFTFEQSESVAAASAVAGQTVVFTGKMESGSRKDLETKATQLGAKVGSSVSSKTDLLVTGANVGASKLDKARRHGVRVIDESEYLALLNSEGADQQEAADAEAITPIAGRGAGDAPDISQMGLF